jgi:hypothetical protein
MTPCEKAGALRCMRARSYPDQEFTEPVALSSTSPVNLWLPPTAPGSGFDLLALRARCKREPRARRVGAQGARQRVSRYLRELLRSQRELAERAACSKGPDQKFTEPVALSSTSPVNLRLPPTALRSGFDLLALRARCRKNVPRNDLSVQGAGDGKSRAICGSPLGKSCGFHRRAGGGGHVSTVHVPT